MSAAGALCVGINPHTCAVSSWYFAKNNELFYTDAVSVVPSSFKIKYGTRTLDVADIMPNFVLIAEAAEQSSYTTQHISLLLRQGRVKGRKVGRIWLVDLDDLKRYEQEMNELGTHKFDPTKGDKE